MKHGRATILLILLAGTSALCAAESGRIHCETSQELQQALKTAGPGDIIVLQGGTTYETEKGFRLRASGTENERIMLTSEDATGQGRYAVITTVDQRKEDDLVAIELNGAYWHLSRLEISGKRLALDDGYWDTNGFRIGLFLNGPGSHHNLIEDLHIHGTHNTAVAIRDLSHHNTFRRMNIHHAGEWLHEDYNAHEGEGFYIGSSKGLDQAGNRARVHDILIEDSTIGPGLLGQYLDIKYGASNVTARNNVFYCGEKSYNREVVKLAGFANLIEGNEFVGSARNLARYVHVFSNNKIEGKEPVRTDYRGQENIPVPTGLDNVFLNNVFYTDDPNIELIRNDLSDADRASLQLENNVIRPQDAYRQRPGTTP
jgi:hypothetical protein